MQAATFRRDLGGAESNVAIHLARAGHRVSWHSALGADAFGGDLRGRFEAGGGVGCQVRPVPNRPTGLYLKELGRDGTHVRYYRKESAASTPKPDDARSLWELQPRLVHTMEITAASSESSHAAMETLLDIERRDSLLGFDVNYRQSLHTIESARRRWRMARHADIVVCDLDEAHTLWGCSTVDETRRVLCGPGVAVIKQGACEGTVFRASAGTDRRQMSKLSKC